MRPQPGIEPGRYADDDGEDAGGDRQLERRRQPLDDELERRLVEDEGAAEIALEGVAEEEEVLQPERLVEAERRRRACHLGLIGLRVDQDVDRVADGEDADEDEERHDEQHDDALHQAADDENGHVSREASQPGAGSSRRARSFRRAGQGTPRREGRQSGWLQRTLIWRREA